VHLLGINTAGSLGLLHLHVDLKVIVVRLPSVTLQAVPLVWLEPVR
jgi:hypothetical protein